MFMKNNELNLISIINDAKINNLRNFYISIAFNSYSTRFDLTADKFQCAVKKGLGKEIIYLYDFERINDIREIKKCNERVKEILLENGIQKSEVIGKVINSELVDIAFDIIKIIEKYKYESNFVVLEVEVSFEYACSLYVCIYDCNKKIIYNDIIFHLDDIKDAYACKETVLNILSSGKRHEN